MDDTTENELDQMILARNPKGGRPMKTGQMTIKHDSDVDVLGIREESVMRYHLGYCQCSRAIKAGRNTAETLVESLQKKGVVPKKSNRSFRLTLAKIILAGDVDNFRRV